MINEAIQKVKKGEYSLFITETQAYIKSGLWGIDKPVYLNSTEQGIKLITDFELKYESYCSSSAVAVYTKQN